MSVEFNIEILIPTNQNFESIKNSLSSLSQCETGGNEVKIVVIENGKEKDIKDNLSFFKNKNLTYTHIFSKDPGKSNALNFYINNFITENTLLIMPDDDIQYNSKWIINFINHAKKYNKNTFFGGCLKVNYEQEPSQFIKSLLPKSAIGVNEDFYKTNPNYLFFGCNWAAFSNDIKKVGGFNPRFGPGSTTGATGQETEMQNKLVAAKLNKVLIPDNYVTHHVPKNCLTLSWITNRIKRDTFSRILRMKNKKKLAIFSVLYPLAFPAVLITEAFARLFKQGPLLRKLIYFRFLYYSLILHYVLRRTL